MFLLVKPRIRKVHTPMLIKLYPSNKNPECHGQYKAITGPWMEEKIGECVHGKVSIGIPEQWATSANKRTRRLFIYRDNACHNVTHFL